MDKYQSILPFERQMEKNKLRGIWTGLSIIFVVGLLIGTFLIAPKMKQKELDMDQKRDALISLRMDIQDEMMSQHNYRCCLEKPCTYCIEKSPGHGEGAICNCLEDIVNGVHSCGECIGEILEGHGNKYLAEYFAAAIAEKVGEEHLDTLHQIIEQKYGIPAEDQY